MGCTFTINYSAYNGATTGTVSLANQPYGEASASTFDFSSCMTSVSETTNTAFQVRREKTNHLLPPMTVYFPKGFFFVFGVNTSRVSRIQTPRAL